MYKFVHFILLSIICCIYLPVRGQNIADRVQVTGTFNGNNPQPYGADYRTTTYRRLSIATGNPTDGRGQWNTTINVQPAGGDIQPISMTGGSNGFEFISGPAANRFAHRWAINNGGILLKDMVSDLDCYNCAGSNAIGMNMMQPGFYTINFNDGNYSGSFAKSYIAYTASKPVSISRTVELLNPDGSLTITMGTSTVPSPQEKVYLRYTTGADFSGSTPSIILQATPISGPNFTITTPVFPDNTIVRYYLFTSTRTLAQLNAGTEIQKSLAVLNYDDNNGVNYSHRAGTLSVKITHFSGRAVDDHIDLSFVAQNEVDMLRYEIYKSNNGVAFTEAGTVNAIGNSISHQYAFRDIHPNTIGNYYKIICVDRGGKRSVTEIIKVNYNAINNTLTIYPNPVERDLNVSLADMQAGQYRIMIYGDGGQMVYSQPYEHNGSDKTIHLVLPQTIKTGPYRIYISNQYEFFKGTFIVR